MKRFVDNTLVVCALGLTMACSVAPDLEHQAEEGNGLETLGVTEATVVIGSDDASGVSLLSGKSFNLFKDTLHPVLKDNCSGCHATEFRPFFAAEDHVSSLQALVETEKVSVANSAQSRLVVRLSNDLHNCWGDCVENADEMLAAIDSWLAGVGDATGGSSEYRFTTSEAVSYTHLTLPTRS